LCQAQGIVPDHIATICAAALCYDGADDPHAVRLQTMIREQGVHETLRQVSGVDPAGAFGREVILQYKHLRGAGKP